MDKKIHEKRLAQWTKVIEECNASGLTKRQWCQENNISEKVFHYWQRRVREAVLEKETPKSDNLPTIVELSAPVKKEDNPLPSVQTQTAAVLHVNGTVIEITEAASADFIQKLLGVVSYVQ